MKTLSIVVALASLLLAPSRVLAAECTQADLDAYTKLTGGTDAQQACAALLKASGLTTIDSSTLLALNPCNDKPCLAYYEKFASELSPCTFQGFPLRQPFDALIAVCKRVPGGPPPPPFSMMPTTSPGAETSAAPATGAANSTATTSPTPTTATGANATASPVQTPVPAGTSAAPAHTAVAVAVLVGSTLASLVAL